VQAAIDAYTDCLALDPENENPAFTSKIYCNRAAAYLKLNKNLEAYNDCSKCIDLDENFSKAFLRRAQAASALGDLEHLETCVRDYQRAKTLLGESGDRDTLKDVERGLADAKTKLKAARRKDYYKVRALSATT
jgi:DnaJ family protein C protein 7